MWIRLVIGLLLRKQRFCYSLFMHLTRVQVQVAGRGIEVECGVRLRSRGIPRRQADSLRRLGTLGKNNACQGSKRSAPGRDPARKKKTQPLPGFEPNHTGNDNSGMAALLSVNGHKTIQERPFYRLGMTIKWLQNGH